MKTSILTKVILAAAVMAVSAFQANAWQVSYQPKDLFKNTDHTDRSEALKELKLVVQNIHAEIQARKEAHQEWKLSRVDIQKILERPDCYGGEGRHEWERDGEGRGGDDNCRVPDGGSTLILLGAGMAALAGFSRLRRPAK